MLKEFGEIIEIPKDGNEFALLLAKNIKEYLFYLEFNVLKDIIGDIDYYVYDFETTSYRNIKSDDGKTAETFYHIRLSCGSINKTYLNLTEENGLIKKLYDIDGVIDISLERDIGVDLIYSVWYFLQKDLMESIKGINKFDL